MTNVLPESIRIAALRARLTELGGKPAHVDYVLRRWTRRVPFDAGPVRAADYLPARLRAAWPGLLAELERLLVPLTEENAADGSVRLLSGLIDGRTLESVLLPRDGVCVSTQVGCAVGCAFCMTGRDGLLRQLGSAEIVAQVVLARRYRRVKKVAFMGMGEPAHNLDQVVEAIDVLGSVGDIGHKNLVFSTVGDRRVFDRLPRERVRPALALSLHSTDAAVRARLMPNAPRIPPEELVELGEAYARATGYPIQYQWTLIEGVNDSDAELDALVRLLAGKYAVMNLIPYNRIDGVAWRRPDMGRAAAMSLHLYRHGILTKLRQSAGQAIDGGCGQLRARHAAQPAQAVSAGEPAAGGGAGKPGNPA